MSQEFFFFLVGGGVGKVLLAVEPRDSGISLGNALLLSHTPNMSRYLCFFFFLDSFLCSPVVKYPHLGNLLTPANFENGYLWSSGKLMDFLT